MKLSEKLKETINELEQAQITDAEAQSRANLAEIRKQRADIEEWLEINRKTIVDTIESGNVPYLRVTATERKKWLDLAKKHDAPHQDLWKNFQHFFRSEGLDVIIGDDSDKNGMTWKILSVKVLPPRHRGAIDGDIGVYNG